jgi:hypothetical protein
VGILRGEGVPGGIVNGRRAVAERNFN